MLWDEEEEQDEVQLQIELEKQKRAEQHSILSQNILTLIDDTEHKDVTFIVGKPNEPSKTLFAHKYILATRSDVFRSMFFNGFKEEKTDVVKIPNISFDIFMLMMEYIYSGQITITSENVMPLILAVDQYGISELRSKCYEFLVMKLNTQSCCAMILDAQDQKYQFNCDELIASCMKYVSKNAEEILHLDVFLEFNESVLLEIVKNDELNVSELELFKSIIRWGLEQKKRTKRTLYELVARFIPYIRYPLIDGKDLLRIVRPCNVVPLDTYIEALEYQSTPGSIQSTEKRFQERDSNIHFDLEVPKSYSTNFLIKRLTMEKQGGGASWQSCQVYGSKKMSTGKFYWEIVIDNIQSNDQSGTVFGITMEKSKNAQTSYFSKDIAIGMSGSVYNCQGNNWGGANNGDVIGIYVNFQQLKIYFFKNGKYVHVCGDLKKGVAYYPVFHIYYQMNKFTVKFPSKIPMVK